MQPIRGKSMYYRVSIFLMLMLSAGCGGGGSSYNPPAAPVIPPNTIIVGPNDIYSAANIFKPNPLTVTAGTTVTWRWDTAGHTVDSGSACTPDAAYSSGGVQAAGFSMTHQFPTAGTYHYYCTTHCGLGMSGTIVVQ